MVIVDSPGIGDSEQTNKIVLDYLPRAYAFIYVLNSSNAGGLQEDRVSKKINKAMLSPSDALDIGRVVRVRVRWCCVIEKNTSLSQPRAPFVQYHKWVLVNG